MIGYCEVKTKQLELIIVELLCIVRNDYPQDPKQAYDILPNEIFGVSFSDFGERLRLYPLGSIIYGDQQKLLL